MNKSFKYNYTYKKLKATDNRLNYYAEDPIQLVPGQNHYADIVSLHAFDESNNLFLLKFKISSNLQFRFVSLIFDQQSINFDDLTCDVPSYQTDRTKLSFFELNDEINFSTSKTIEKQLYQLNCRFLPSGHKDHMKDFIALEKVSGAFASEKWSKSYLRKVRKTILTNYFQTGEVQIELSIDGNCTQLKCIGFRDHEWGYKNFDEIKTHTLIRGISSDWDIINIGQIHYEFSDELFTGYTRFNGLYQRLEESGDLETIKSNDFKLGDRCSYHAQLSHDIISLQFTFLHKISFRINKGNYWIDLVLAESTYKGKKFQFILENGYNMEQF